MTHSPPLTQALEHLTVTSNYDNIERCKGPLGNIDGLPIVFVTKREDLRFGYFGSLWRRAPLGYFGGLWRQAPLKYFGGSWRWSPLGYFSDGCSMSGVIDNLEERLRTRTDQGIAEA